MNSLEFLQTFASKEYVTPTGFRKESQFPLYSLIKYMHVQKNVISESVFTYFNDYFEVHIYLNKNRILCAKDNWKMVSEIENINNKIHGYKIYIIRDFIMIIFYTLNYLIFCLNHHFLILILSFLHHFIILIFSLLPQHLFS